MRVRFPLPAPRCADIAQLVERTLGKGEVGSSNLPISTTSFLLPVFSFCLLHSTSRACCLVDVVISPIYPCLRGTIDDVQKAERAENIKKNYKNPA